jgi:hypothetical protein
MEVGLLFAVLIMLAALRITNSEPSTKQSALKTALGRKKMSSLFFVLFTQNHTNTLFYLCFNGEGLWLLLALLMGYRFYNSLKLFPAGLVFLISVLLSIYNYLQLS